MDTIEQVRLQLRKERGALIVILLMTLAFIACAFILGTSTAPTIREDAPIAYGASGLTFILFQVTLCHWCYGRGYLKLMEMTDPSSEQVLFIRLWRSPYRRNSLN